jgi:hypothetical protein
MIREKYKYKVFMEYNDQKSIISIPSDQVVSFSVIKDFDTINFPVVAVTSMLERDILDYLIKNQDTTTINFGVYRYDVNNQNDNITTKYFVNRFIYIIEESESKRSSIDYNENSEYEEHLTRTNIYLLPQDSLNNSKKIINGVYKNTDMNSMVINISNYIGKLLVEPLTYNTKYDQVLIPPIDSISSYLYFLNNQLNILYDTKYRFFMDFDMSYLMSSAGNVVKCKTHKNYTVNIDVADITAIGETEDSGMIVDLYNGKYIINVSSSECDYNDNRIVNKMMNNIITINSNGDHNEKTLNSNNAKTTIFSKIINLSTKDNNFINNITNEMDISTTMATVIKKDIDPSIFTLNREYIITDRNDSKRSGRYLLYSIKEIYSREDSTYTLTAILQFKKLTKNKGA